MDNTCNIETPFFIIDEKELKKNVIEFKDALNKYWGNYILGYSCKTNSLPWVLNFMNENDCYAEVVSDRELELVEYIGFRKERIIFNGPHKGKEKFLWAIKNDIILNIDSNNEIEWLKKEKFDKEVKIGIRINFDLEKYCPGETSFGIEGSRFGFSLENGMVKKILNELNSIKNVKVAGIHIHYTAKTRSLNVYKILAKKACEVASLIDYDLDYIDIGGGFFGGVPGKTTFDEYLEVISKELEEKIDKSKTKLIVEPGSAIIGSPVSFTCKVIDVKETFANRIVVTDGSRNNIDPFMMKNSYFYRLDINEKNRASKISQMIAGYTCLDYDRLMTLKNQKELIRGDRIIFDKVGAYTMALSPLFIEYFPSVYLLKDGKYTCIREKWGIEEYIKKSRWK